MSLFRLFVVHIFFHDWCVLCLVRTAVKSGGPRRRQTKRERDNGSQLSFSHSLRLCDACCSLQLRTIQQKSQKAARKEGVFGAISATTKAIKVFLVSVLCFCAKNKTRYCTNQKLTSSQLKKARQELYMSLKEWLGRREKGWRNWSAKCSWMKMVLWVSGKNKQRTTILFFIYICLFFPDVLVTVNIHWKNKYSELW